MSLKAFLGPMFAVGMLCGTVPLRVTSLHPIQLRVSRSRITYTMVLVTLTFFNMVFTTLRIIYEEDANATVPPAVARADCNAPKEQSQLHSIALKLINAQTLIFMSLGSHWVSVRRLVPKFPILIDYIVSIDRKLPLLNCDLRLDKTYFSLGLKFCMLLVATVPVFLFYIGLNSRDKHVFWYVSLVFHNLVSYSCELQLLIFFLFIKCRFRIINDVLSLRNRENDNRIKTLSMRKIQEPSLEDRNLLKHIDVIHASYLKLCDSWVILNDIYSVQVLFSTSGCFLKAIFNVYILMSSDSSTNNDRNLNSLMWLVFYFYRFTFLAAVATLTAEEANKTKAIIAYMSCFYFEKCIKEEDRPQQAVRSVIFWAGHYHNYNRISLRYQLLLLTTLVVLSFQLEVFWVNACCRDLEFSTCGLFKLNSSLITKACVTGITYLVLLVQFNPQM